MKTFLSEAFQQMELLESNEFTFDKSGAEELANFVEGDMLTDFEAIIDPEAETTADLKDSYIGNVVCECQVCKSKIYKDPEEVVVDEESAMANVGECCPYCFERDGYKIIGQIAPYEEVTVEAEEPVDVEVDGKSVSVTTEEDEDDSMTGRHMKDNEDLEDSQRYPVEGTKQVDLTEAKKKKFSRHARDNEDLEDSQRFPVEGTKQVDLKEELAEEEEARSEKTNKFKLARKMRLARHKRDNEDLEDSQRYPIESPQPAQTGLAMMEKKELEEDTSIRAKLKKAFPQLKLDKKEECLKEGMEDISITTDDQVIKVKATPRADKEAIQPVEEETKEVIETPVDEVEEVADDTVVDETVVEEPAESEDVEIDEFDEAAFDELSEGYLKQVYDNVSSFKTTQGSMSGNKIMIEGIIKFNSGKSAKTKFVFEAATKTRGGKLKFKGLNEHITTNKNSFTLTGSMDGSKLLAESLNYNYGAKADSGKVKRIYGTVRRGQ